MQTHLASCAACRNELRELRLVSDLLQADSAPDFTPAERFVSELTLSLPRRPPKPGSLAWWLVPAGLLAAWFFVRTVLTLTDVVTAANVTGLLGQAAGWLGSRQETIWFGALTSLSGGQVATQPALSMLNNVSVFGANLLSGFLWQAVIVLLYWAWLFLWWLRRSSRPMKMRNTS
jgi:anti-sigma factor RsiW